MKGKHNKKGVYKHKASGRYEIKVKDHDGNWTYIGLADTKAEGRYRHRLHKNGHHWETPYGDALGTFGFGFTYLMTHKVTGKKYVGSKQFYYWDGPTGGYKCTDPADERWEPLAWREGMWETYTSSSDDINLEILHGNIWDFKYEVLQVYENKLDLHIAEVLELKKRGVLEATGPTGKYLYYNKNIGRVEFRAPYDIDKVAEMKEKSLKEMTLYYLKPNECYHCNEPLPFGRSTFTCECRGSMVKKTPVDYEVAFG